MLGVMKVLMLGWELPPLFAGGVGVACEALVRALLRRGVRVVYAHPSHDTEGARVALKPAREHVRVPSPLRSYASAPSIALPGEAPRGNPAPALYGSDLLDAVARFALDATTLAERAGPDLDVIHAHDWTTFPAGLALRARTGKPLVAHVHILELDKSSGLHVDPRVEAIERAGLLAADRVIAVSQRMARLCHEHHDVPPERIRVVHNAVEPTVEAGPPLGLPGPLVLFLGRVTFQKGPEAFLRAARYVLDVFPDVTFVMAGSGDLLPRMIELSAELGLGRRMLFTGFASRESAARLYARADVFVMPSVSEPFGLVALEAMRGGAAVIVSHDAGVAEIARNVVRVDARDFEALGECILASLRYPALASELGERARREVERHDWDTAATRVHGVYLELCA